MPAAAIRSGERRTAPATTVPTGRPTCTGKASGAISAPPRNSVDACHAAEHDGADLAPNRRQRQRDDCRHDRERGAWTIRRERTGHAEHRLRDDRNRSDLEAMQPARACGVAERVDAVAEQDHGDRRRQRESYPGCQGAGVTRAQQPDGDADLARSRPRQELAKGDEIGVAAVVEPTPPDDELVAKIAEMRDRSAEGGQSQPKEYGKDFKPVTWNGSYRRGPRRAAASCSRSLDCLSAIGIDIRAGAFPSGAPRQSGPVAATFWLLRLVTAVRTAARCRRASARHRSGGRDCIGRNWASPPFRAAARSFHRA